jgi:hypothetical protein
VKTKNECVIDTEGDQRRKLNLKRKIDVLENDRRLLLRLLETIRTAQDSRVTELVSFIRSSATTDYIKLSLDLHLQRTEPEQTTQSTNRYVDGEQSQNSQKRRARILADAPIVTVPAKPWTTVTDDDAWVSYLISLWLTWHLPWFHCIDREIFISAMQSGNPQSPLCSPFLVNAVLAEACVGLLQFSLSSNLFIDDTTGDSFFLNTPKRPQSTTIRDQKAINFMQKRKGYWTTKRGASLSQQPKV